MATKDGLPPDDPFPAFLSEHAELPEHPGIGKVWDGAAISSRIVKTGILVVAAAAIDCAMLSMGNPAALFANVTPSLVDISALQPGTRQSTPTIQSNPGAQALPPTARDAPTRDESAAALESADQSQTEIRQPSAEALLKQFQAWAAEEETRDEITGAIEPADQSQTEIRQPSGEALLKQFQAWAAEEDAQARVGPVEPVQDARAPAVQNARAQVRPMQKHRQVHPVRNARAEIRPKQNARAKVRPVQNAQAHDRSVQDAQAQDRSVQNAQAPLRLQSVGWLD
jgi:hypothetical protein